MSTGRAENDRYDAGPYLPRRGGIPALRRAAEDCRGCPLYREATGTVFGSGSTSARIMLVGEVPGDQEDRQGKPFVGPAGLLLRKALREAGLDEEKAYFTNAVKHFKFTVPERGKRRIHKSPNLREMTACRPWLSAELRLVAPEVVVALGATAGRALLGSSFRVTKDRGTVIPLPPPNEPSHAASNDAAEETGERMSAVATLHPSAVLRSKDRSAAYHGLVCDLRVALAVLR